MKFTKFTVVNFKGIERAEIDLEPAGANVFTLIGLNESGKTTILEALSTFSIIKEQTDALYEQAAFKTDPTTYVPKNLKSNFTGDITVTAEVCFDVDEKEEILRKVERDTGARFIRDTIPNKFSITRGYKFESSDFKKNIYSLSVSPQYIPKGARNSRVLGGVGDIWEKFAQHLTSHVPQIIYFPTFLFNQPEKIILNPGSKEKPINRLYRQIVSNIASALPRPLDVKTHIVDRVLGVDNTNPITNLFTLGLDKQKQVEAVLNEMASHVTETVFSSWKKIFGGDFFGREVVLKVGIEAEDNTNFVYVQFSIKDRKSNYDLIERSLGFRWFFSFLLFTFYRVSGANGRPVLFLLDEPASNLHARAQMQLMDSFPKIAVGNSQIMYSTHSHYLINPAWLDQAFIVSNKAIDYEHVDDSQNFGREGNTKIEVERYRQFVGKNPDKITYFQPVLDKLDVIPSKLELIRKSVLVEGKGDFLILEYGRRILLGSDSDVCVVPTRGATGMDELIGLFMGWGVSFIICLDDDEEGVKARKKYIEQWGLSEETVYTLKHVSSDLAGKEISSFLEKSDLEKIRSHFNQTKMPTKGQIQLFFSEHLAKKEKLIFSQKFTNRIESFDAFIVSNFPT